MTGLQMRIMLIELLPFNVYNGDTVAIIIN